MKGKRLPVVLLVILIVSLPLLLLGIKQTLDNRTRAAAADKLETESGTLSSTGVQILNDSSASGGQYISFSAASAANPFSESDGIVVMEAENYDNSVARNNHSWVNENSVTGASGNQYVVANPDDGSAYDTNYSTQSPETIYNVKFTNTGTYYVWVRANAPDSASNSFHIGLNGQELPSVASMRLDPGVWVWSNLNRDAAIASLNIPSAGNYVINLWAREDGARIDKIMLTRDSNYTPSGTGPAESTRSSGGSTTSSPTPTPTTAVTPPPTSGGLKAFPSAVGWGKDATGGRGGVVRKVTNLNDSGTGSLRAAWEATGKATIIFEVAGTITVSGSIRATGDKTIAGETAFRNGGQGITVRRNGNNSDSVIMGNMNNTIVRFMRFRAGPGANGDCCGDNITVYSGNSSNIIFDHSSFSWSTDESINLWGPHKNATFQNIIISEPLYFSTHIEDGVTQRHGYAFLSGSDDNVCSTSTSHITLFNTLIAHSDGRNPLFAGGCAEHEIVNTVLFNWGHFGLMTIGGSKRVNIINLYGINGPDTSSSRYVTSLDPNTRAYVKGIYDRKNNYGANGDWAAMGSSSIDTPAPTSLRVTSPFDYPLKDYPLLTRNEIENIVDQNAGANLYRDSVDQRAINNQGGFIDHPSEVGGWPTLSNMSSVPLDSDNDGMPNTYEDSKGLNKNNASDGSANSGDGYTNLEKYLFSLTGDI